MQARSCRLALLLLAVLLPHGGIYRPVPPPPPVPRDPPADPPPRPPHRPGDAPSRPSPGTPTGPRGSGGGGAGHPATGGPTLPAAPRTGPLTPRGVPLEADGSSVLLWWGYQQDEFMRRRAADRAAPVSGSDDVFFGASRRVDASDHQRPSDADVRARIVPALFASLEAGDDRHVQTSALLALAKTGAEPERLLAACRRLLASPHQTVRECAALAAGIAGLAAAAPDLHALALDAAPGQRLVQRGSVDERTREFAVYALGLLAERRPDQAAELLVATTGAMLAADSPASRGLQVAAVHALRLLPPPRTRSQERVRLEALAQLQACFARPGGASHQLVRAQIPAAWVALAGPDGDRSGRLRRLLAAELRDGSAALPWVRQSAALALGDLLAPPEQDPHAVDAVLALRDACNADRDRQTRGFAAIALAKIGGPGNRRHLLEQLPRAPAATERPWLAIALGLVAHRAGAADPAITAELRRELAVARTPELIGAAAIALGLAGARDAEDLLLLRLAEHLPQDDVAGALATGLALLGTDRGFARLRELIDDAVRRPELLRQLGIALARRGDRESAARMLALLEASGANQPILTTAASALGTIGDRRSLEPLAAMLADAGRPSLVRGNAAVALGGLADRSPVPWNARLAAGANYRANVPGLTNGQDGVLDIY